jgi:hypothetical protein
MNFYEDRALISELSDEHASRILELLDAGVPHEDSPSEFRAALAATRRIPDVSRFLLVEKSRQHLDRESRRDKEVE